MRVVGHNAVMTVPPLIDHLEELIAASNWPESRRELKGTCTTAQASAAGIVLHQVCFTPAPPQPAPRWWLSPAAKGKRRRMVGSGRPGTRGLLAERRSSREFLAIVVAMITMVGCSGSSSQKSPYDIAYDRCVSELRELARRKPVPAGDIEGACVDIASRETASSGPARTVAAAPAEVPAEIISEVTAALVRAGLAICLPFRAGSPPDDEARSAQQQASITLAKCDTIQGPERSNGNVRVLHPTGVTLEQAASLYSADTAPDLPRIYKAGWVWWRGWSYKGMLVAVEGSSTTDVVQAVQRAMTSMGAQELFRH